MSTPYSAMGDAPIPQTATQRLASQDDVIRQQDQSLAALSRSVATLNNLGNEIHGELRAQGNLLDDLERGVDQTRDALVSQQSRLKKLIKRTRDNWLFFMISARNATSHTRTGAALACLRSVARPLNWHARAAA